MEEILKWLPIIVLAITNTVAITLSYASLKQKIAVSDVLTGEKFKAIEEKITTKFDVLSGQVDEIKINHLHDLRDDIKRLEEKLNVHLQQGAR